jgi:hypothetical protein
LFGNFIKCSECACFEVYIAFETEEQRSCGSFYGINSIKEPRIKKEQGFCPCSLLIALKQKCPVMKDYFSPLPPLSPFSPLSSF